MGNQRSGLVDQKAEKKIIEKTKGQVRSYGPKWKLQLQSFEEANWLERRMGPPPLTLVHTAPHPHPKPQFLKTLYV